MHVQGPESSDRKPDKRCDRATPAGFRKSEEVNTHVPRIKTHTHTHTQCGGWDRSVRGTGTLQNFLWESNLNDRTCAEEAMWWLFPLPVSR